MMILCACMCLYVQKVMAFLAASGVSVLRNQLSKRLSNYSKTPLTVLGLEHPTSGAQVMSCTIEPSELRELGVSVCVCVCEAAN